jgi:hypothetical protein
MASVTDASGFGHDFAAIDNDTLFVSSQISDALDPFVGAVDRYGDPLVNESVSFTPGDDLEYYYYGSDLEVSSECLVVSAGDVYGDGVFNARGTIIIQDQETGDELSRLSPKHLQDYASFGGRGGIALHGDKLLVLAWGGLLPDGEEYPRELFMYDLANPNQPSLLWHVPDPEFVDEAFGLHSLALSDEYAVVSRFTSDSHIDEGEVYIQIHDIQTGEVVRTVDISDDMSGFSIQLPSVAVHRDMLVVGHVRADVSSRVSVFRISTGELVYQLQPGNLNQWENFGDAVDAIWPTIIVSAPESDESTEEAGSVFVYNLLDDSVCFADMNRDGVLNFFDVSSFLVAFIDGDPRADIDFSGEPSFFDLSYFLQNYKAGCP